MRKYSFLILSALISLAIFNSNQAKAQQVSQVTITSQLNQDAGGPALPNMYSAQVSNVYVGGSFLTASTACKATLADMSDAMTDTASVSCANTGEIKMAGWYQATIEMRYILGPGTKVWMQCDQSKNNRQTWGPIYVEDSDGIKKIRESQTPTTASTGNITTNFPLNADYMRCRGWIDGGDATSKIFWIVRVGS
jgi:hypothetical protein